MGRQRKSVSESHDSHDGVIHILQFESTPPRWFSVVGDQCDAWRL